MELAPCNEQSRQSLVNMLNKIRDQSSSFDDVKKSVDYVIKTFPNILLDVARCLTEQATTNARNLTGIDLVKANLLQLKPFFVFGWLLGKSPQVTGFMYNYFEDSSFQPLPENSFQIHLSSGGDQICQYNIAGYDDNIIKDILITYLKYLSYNPKWFSAVWNWSELGRFISSHPSDDIRFLAANCLSIITKPSRHQHESMMQYIIRKPQDLIDLQLKYSFIYENNFRPLIESNTVRVTEYVKACGRSENGYPYCSESLTKITNILLLKRQVDAGQYVKDKSTRIIENFLPVPTLSDTISMIAYSASINKPCLIRGPTGCGKTAVLDYVAAHTNRISAPDYVKVQVGDQIDSKSLIGSYVCTEIPGQFEWQPGPLTQAMAYGSWIVFEDIDLAPSEMAQVIHSVIENGNLTCVSCCPIKMDSPHPDFRIFFTQRTKSFTNPDHLRLGFGFIERLCDIVDMPELCDIDLEEILEKRYKFGSIKQTILKLFETAKLISSESSIGRATRAISMRDLFKFCDRVSDKKLKINNEKYATSDLDSLLIDAIDCFIASLPSEHMTNAAERLGLILNKPPNEVNALITRRPEIRNDGDTFAVGRVKLKSSKTADSKLSTNFTLAATRQSIQLLESISLCVKNRETALLVGETGVGKTTIVQYLAQMMKTNLIVMNVSQQSDSSDLLGGYRPVEMREVIKPVNDKFINLFEHTFNMRENEAFLRHTETLYRSSKKCSEWLIYLNIVLKMCTRALERKDLSKDRLDGWGDLLVKVRRMTSRLSEHNSSPMALAFSEGTLLRAIRKGYWLLLDEINLAEPDVLQCLILVLDSMRDSHVFLHGSSDKDAPIQIHPNFRMFACMNPSTDIGKRDLPTGIRCRFTELFFNDVDDVHDLRLIVNSYVKACLKPPQIERIVNFYREVRHQSNTLSDVSGNAPVYSLRTLCRALVICSQNVCHNMEKSLLESLKITFLQQLNEPSVYQVMKLIENLVFETATIQHINEIEIPMPNDNHQYTPIQGFWLQMSSQKKSIDENYIITRSVEKNLQRLCRIICLGQRKLPILIQGNTSVGKTSLIKYLAKLSGNYCIRINNHEHTDLQDYVGRYVLRESGELQFQDGLLVTAMKKGYWVILDELNLAPCELLEALNRVLDDNRELFIPETRETVLAHSKFTLFATQNPPEEYAGRKMLSRAFRNRFIELHFDEIPHHELEEILQKRCRMPYQYAHKIVTVMKELQLFRRESGCFGGKGSFMTMRDLFRWGERYASFAKSVSNDEFLDWNEFLATEGLILLEGRVRTTNEADIVKNIIEKVFRLKLDRDLVYSYEIPTDNISSAFKHIQFTREFKRMFVQLSQAFKFNEPVLLCGQTGCGKTTACQLYASLMKQDLLVHNCHLNTESSDFIGNVRPMRDDNMRQTFPWRDGTLVQAMKKGSIYLLDEISLADDAVLERINSVLESDRTLTLTEKNGEEVRADDAFRIVATMNPGGDYGKKELSPALRNRFTEIYCHNTRDIAQIVNIIGKSLGVPLLKPSIAPNLIGVMKNFLSEYYRGQDIISLRDVLSWTKFLNQTTKTTSTKSLTVQQALIEGASLVYFDQFGTCGHKSIHSEASTDLRNKLKRKLIGSVESKIGKEPVYVEKVSNQEKCSQDYIEFGKFYLRRGPEKVCVNKANFIMDAPTVKMNAEKIVRAMQLDRPILLEGDPGAGKTSIVSALATLSGHKLVRINLSEQTDISDLFGSDLPDISDQVDDSPKFRWHDGPMLKAIKESSWILLDEMNLASQSVLEGLNACFDHRGEIYIPELDKKFCVDRNTTKIFACQNPYNQGAARKGLPQSFLNRFTSIYIETHSDEDLNIVLEKLYPSLPTDLITKMIIFNKEVSKTFGVYGFEFNLRDLIYWCDLMTKYARGGMMKESSLYQPDRFVQFVYIDRMRSLIDRAEVSDIFERVFGHCVYEPPYRDIKLGEHSLIMTRSILSRKLRTSPQLADLCVLKFQIPYMESIAKALEFNKMPILVGEPGVGKRTMIKILAGLTGNNLNIIGANNEMDTVELLGSFEQKSLQREIIDLVNEITKYTIDKLNSLSCYSTAWTQLYKLIWSTLYESSLRDISLSKSKIMDAYRFQLVQLETLLKEIKPAKQESRDKDLMRKVSLLKKKVLFHSESTYSSGNFEWIDSILLKSIKEGSWLIIENANLMNPATLDRLNSLVEPNGMLILNEKGSDEDGIETIKPHPDFRLILTMNPEYGELSRAMRNRGIEIYVRTRFLYEDFLMLLNQRGFVPEEDSTCMTSCILQTSYDTHEKIAGEKPEDDGSLLAYFGLNYLSILTHQIRRGVDVDTRLADLLISFYQQRGHLEAGSEKAITSFVRTKMNEYREKFFVKMIDDRYKWFNFRHDLVALSSGDAITSMLNRENKLLTDCPCPISTGLLKADEMIEEFEVVVICTNIKIFLESATHGDLEHRKTYVRDFFSAYPKIIDLINSEIESLQLECVPMIVNHVPSISILPLSEIYVDTRHASDLHYFLQSLDHQGSIAREDLQNRWLLSLYRVNLTMISSLIEERSLENPDSVSLWMLSERVRSGQMLKDDLIKPQAEIATDLYDLLFGLLRIVTNRCYSDKLLVKMIGRAFWISYFLCKLKRGYTKMELVALCNQMSMLWALTYQKVIVPLISDCELADLSYNNKKLSSRIQHVCDFLDVNITKPGKVEKDYYYKILNSYAGTTKRFEIICREMDKIFSTLMGRYIARAQAFSIGSENQDTLVASNLTWSNSNYMSSMYNVISILQSVDGIEEDRLQDAELIRTRLAEANEIITKKRHEYQNHEEWIKNNDTYRSRCSNVNRRRCALDQFAPIWQMKFVNERFSRLTPEMSAHTSRYFQMSLRRLLNDVNGISMSPRYYQTLIKFLKTLEYRQVIKDNQIADEDCSILEMANFPREDADMYAALLVDQMLEHSVVDSQIVGWTKLRVHNIDLPSTAPLIPEYSPIISLVSSYCLDIAHLKLNSYQNSNPQLESLLTYLWRAYSRIKLGMQCNQNDLNLAQTLIHLKSKSSDFRELVGDYVCKQDRYCKCIDMYIKRRAPMYEEILNLVKERCNEDDRVLFERSLKLIYFGFYNFLENAPIFTLDPSIRFREKQEVYKSELAHIKADLYQRNTLHYWKTGENLRLVDVTISEARLYPFPLRVLIERRVKLEKSVKKLKREFTNRPKSDDGTLYYELRKEVEISISRNTNTINSLVNDMKAFFSGKKLLNQNRSISTLASRCRMFIRSLEKSISKFKSEFVLYRELTTNYLTGLCFVLQGMRILYSRVEQKLQIIEMSPSHKFMNGFSNQIMSLFSFSDFTSNNLHSVNNKRAAYSMLSTMCPVEHVSYIQSLLLKSVLIQLNHHIVSTPSDIQRCIPIVHNIADKFSKAWLERKKYLEAQRKKHEDLYQYRTSTTIVGDQLTFDKKEFIEICSNFPLYDHVYRDQVNVPAMSNESENLETEAKIIKLNQSVDLSMCIDVCKAHYKFMKEASLSLLGDHDQAEPCVETNRKIDMEQILKLEAEVLYTLIRKCAPVLDYRFDSVSLECHLLQANQLIKTLRQSSPELVQIGSLRSSIDILDEEIFDIYYDSCPNEALKFQDFLTRVDQRIDQLRTDRTRMYDSHPLLVSIVKLTSRISSFLITDPFMKFITGAHTLLEKLENWNKAIPRDHSLKAEADSLVDLITSWRQLEAKTWQGSLHRVKRKYIDDTLCDLWFTLYELFNDPIQSVRNFLIDNNFIDEDYEMELDEFFYQAFTSLIKQFFEASTLGDYQIRLDLVFSFAIQTRFASLYEQSKLAQYSSGAQNTSSEKKVDHEKLTTYVYNIYRQYQNLMNHKEIVDREEKQLLEELKSRIRMAQWVGRNLFEIKTNFRISHRVLLKVMNQYLEVLRRPVPLVALNSESNPSARAEEKEEVLNSTILQNILDRTSKLIQKTNSVDDGCATTPLKALSQASKVIAKFKYLAQQVSETSMLRYVGVLQAIESVKVETNEAILSFNSQKVRSIILEPTDTRELRDSKLKLCRQMFHSMKFSLQSIFKSLQQLGVSYQRGLNNRVLLDGSILSMEPLRGMIQNQNSNVMKAATELVDDSLVISCSKLYHKLINKNQILLAQSRLDGLSGEQLERIQGLSLDMILDVITHHRNAAIIYGHLMNIQAASTRLRQLQKRTGDKQIVVYRFARVHNSIKKFNELTSRAHASMAKVELLMDCFKNYSDLQATEALSKSSNEFGYSSASSIKERNILKQMINEIDEKNSLMTQQQYDHLKVNLPEINRELASIGAALREKLKHTIVNYMYSDDDIEEIQHLYQSFIECLGRMVKSEEFNEVNIRQGTILGSLRLLHVEAETKLKPILQRDYFTNGTAQIIEIMDHKNILKLDIRLQRLIRQLKLVVQDIYKEELDYVSVIPSSESEKRKLKPFNHIDSSKMRKSLRPMIISQQVANCFMTLNLEDRGMNVKGVLSKLEPILAIYTQQVARYLNIILTSMHLKLNTSDQLLTFFVKLLVEGFGLPCMTSDFDELSDGKNSTGAENEDNVGFGEGQGKEDASKKLEFESQLDELKNDQGDNENKEKEEGTADEEVAAHDDGVEMSEDFDAKALGPEKSEEENKSDKDGEDDGEDDEQLNELDKEFDQVDEDEGNLDEKLWDDKDETIEEDDGEDLREANQDPSIKPEMDDKDLMAKDANIKQADSNNSEQDNSAANEVDDDHQHELDEDPNHSLNEKPMDDETIDESNIDEDHDDKYSDDETNASEDMTGDGKEEESNIPDMPDMFDESVDMEDVYDQDELEASQETDDLMKDDTDELNVVDESYDEATERSGPEPGCDKANELNAENLDEKNEANHDKEKLQGSSTTGRQDGDVSENMAQATKGEQPPGSQDDDDDLKQAQNSDSDKEKSTKRTIADRNSIETCQQQTIKRQKIEPAEARTNSDDEPVNKDKVESVRHVEVARHDNIEIIDLASDSDEDLLDLGPEFNNIDTSKARSSLEQKSAGDTDTGDQNKSTSDQVTSDDDNKQASSYNTNLGLLKYISHGHNKENEPKPSSSGGNDDELAQSEQASLMEQIDDALKKVSSQDDEHASLEADRLTSLWLECTKSTGHLVYELCQQLQIVLQPTKMSKYKGDYKTGKRLNMRKIISYIASHYRKDKIWLRRTKPCKRTYNISLAVDNSSSMSENNCRQMTYQSLALLAKSLSIIEAGSLNVVSFGEKVKCIHDFDQPYVDAIGAQWLRELCFDETRTSYKKVLMFACESFAKQAQRSIQTASSNFNTSVHQLLVIISDGRNVTSEESEVKHYLRQLKSMGVLTLFIIIDDLGRNNGKSIVDVKTCTKYSGTMRVDNYMDLFPFPFYVLLRQLDSMPSILGDALRQWFELVNSGI